METCKSIMSCSSAHSFQGAWPGGLVKSVTDILGCIVCISCFLFLTFFKWYTYMGILYVLIFFLCDMKSINVIFHKSIGIVCFSTLLPLEIPWQIYGICTLHLFCPQCKVCLKTFWSRLCWALIVHTAIVLHSRYYMNTLRNNVLLSCRGHY